MAMRVHPFPSRTRKLSSSTLTILGWKRPGKIGRRQHKLRRQFVCGVFCLFLAATGIVRRIDDLGRVVIPKKIRRTMRISEDDPLQIHTYIRINGTVTPLHYNPKIVKTECSLNVSTIHFSASVTTDAASPPFASARTLICSH